MYVCTLARNTGPSQHVWPCSCSRANFSLGCAYASVPSARPMRAERMLSQWNPVVTIVCPHPSFFLLRVLFLFLPETPTYKIRSVRFTISRPGWLPVSVCDLSPVTCSQFYLHPLFRFEEKLDFSVLFLNPISISVQTAHILIWWPVRVTIERDSGKEIRADWFTVVRYYLVNPFTLGKWLDKRRV